MSRPLLPIAAFLMALASLAARAGAVEPNGRYTLSYAAYAGGGRVADVAVVAALAPDRYQIDVTATGRGLLGFLAPFKMTAEAGGVITAGAPIARRQRVVNEGRGGKRLSALDFLPDGRVIFTREPPPKPPLDPDPVPDAMKAGSLDPFSAIFAAMRVAEAGDRCAGRFPVYDGKRRYDVVLTDEGQSQLKPGRYGRYAGPARQCRLDYRLLAGLWHEHEWRRSGRPADRIWLARPLVEGPLVPVRIEAAGQTGTLLIYLQAIEADGQTAAIPGR